MHYLLDRFHQRSVLNVHMQYNTGGGRQTLLIGGEAAA